MNGDGRAQDDSCPVCQFPLEIVSVRFNLRRGAMALLACRDCGPHQDGDRRDLLSQTAAEAVSVADRRSVVEATSNFARMAGDRLHRPQGGWWSKATANVFGESAVCQLSFRKDC
jgi:hypothetical protein